MEIQGQEQVTGFLVELYIAIPHVARRQIRLHPYDGLYPRLGGGIEEFHHPEHGAMIGQRQGGHIHFHRALDHLLYVAETVQQGVFGMNVEMDK